MNEISNEKYDPLDEASAFDCGYVIIAVVFSILCVVIGVLACS